MPTIIEEQQVEKRQSPFESILDHFGYQGRLRLHLIMEEGDTQWHRANWWLKNRIGRSKFVRLTKTSVGLQVEDWTVKN